MAPTVGNRAVRAAQLAYTETVGNDQDKMHAAIREAVAHLDRACAVCGCTDEAACPGGCSWEPDLCSACGRDQIFGELVGTPDEPTAYEIWRDALLIAAAAGGLRSDPRRVIKDARAYRMSLVQIPLIVPGDGETT